MRILNDRAIQSALQSIAGTTSTNHKVTLLKKAHPDIRIILKWTYNKFWMYHVRNYEALYFGQGDQPLNERTFQLLRSLRDRRITGHDAVYQVQQHGQHLRPESADLFAKILARDIRAGINTQLINSAFPGLIPEHRVMLAQKVNWRKVLYPCYSSIKLDGVRAIYRDGELYTRGGKLLTGLDHIIQELQNRRSPPLDGELLVPGVSFQEGSGLIRSFSATPEARFCVFEMPDEGGSFSHRYKKLQHFVTDHVRRVPHIPVSNKQQALAHYAECRKRGYEGTVVKPTDYRYVDKRSPNWMKLKAIETLDLTVNGYFEGTGKYQGMLGGFTVGFQGNSVRVGSGFSDQERGYYWDTRDQHVGRIMEVLYQEITPTNSLRHPRFIRWRDDK